MWISLFFEFNGGEIKKPSTSFDADGSICFNES